MQTMTDTNNKGQLFLYMCEECSIASFSKVDNGRVWCAMCQGCKSAQFHDKVVISIDLRNDIECTFMLEEKKYDSDGSKEASKKE